MRIVFFGSGEFGLSSLRFLADEHEVLQVITQPDRPGGRGRQLLATPVKQYAHELQLDVRTVERVNDDDVVNSILELDADLGVVIAFGQKIGERLIQGIRGSCVNAHASLLPKYRGAAPVHWAVINGEEKSGVTIFKLIDRMDAGPMLAQRWTYLKPEETTEELHDRLAGIAVDALRATIDIYEENPNPPGEPQDESQATLAPKLKKEQGYVHFDRPRQVLANHICGMWSWPGARCRFVSQQHEPLDVILARARPAETASSGLTPGSIDSARYVAADDGMLEILQIKPAGGRLMTWPDFVNGHHVQPGDRFEALT